MYISSLEITYHHKVAETTIHAMAVRTMMAVNVNVAQAST